MEIIGKFTSATVYAENIEDAALQWVKAQCDHPAFEGVRIVQMLQCGDGVPDRGIS